MSQYKFKSSMQTSTAMIIAGLAFLAGLLIGSVIAGSTDAGSVQQNAGQSPNQAQSQQLQDLEKTIQQVLSDIEREPDNALHWIHLGNLYYDAQIYPQAIQAYEKALNLNPDEPDVMTDLGTAYRSSGNPEQAIRIFDQVIEKYPDHQFARFNKGVVQMFELEQPAAAYETWRQLLQIAPDMVLNDGNRMADVLDQLLVNIGLDFEQAAKPDLALQAFDLALRENTANEHAMAHKAQLLRNMGRNDEALPLWQAIFQANPQAVAPDGTRVSILANENN